MSKIHPVRRWREANGVSQQDFAKRARIEQPYLSQIENFVKLNPSIRVIDRIIKASNDELTYDVLLKHKTRS